MNSPDPFEFLARYYDRIMDHVDYDRWFMTVTELAALLPREFVHLDAACGTGQLVKRLRRAGWVAFGTDLSRGMLRAGNKGPVAGLTALADLRAMPFAGSIDYATCLFDSINFLTTLDDVRRCLAEIGRALSTNGLLYLDAVTERMVTEHFAGQGWTEDHGTFSSSWQTHYAFDSKIADTEIRINHGPVTLIRERVYEQADIESAFEDAGLTVLGAYDAETWEPPDAKTLRIDFVAAKGDARPRVKAFQKVCGTVKRHLE